MMNLIPLPYRILGVLLLALALVAGGYAYGHHNGVDSQKVVDQAQIDKINQGIADQKVQANALYRSAQDANLALMTERDHLKTTLEKEHANNQIATTALRDKYAGLGLRFNAESPRLGSGGRGTQSAGTDTASAASPAVVQLSDETAIALRSLAFDADQLADAYRECYGYANQVR